MILVEVGGGMSTFHGATNDIGKGCSMNLSAHVDVSSPPSVVIMPRGTLGLLVGV